MQADILDKEAFQLKGSLFTLTVLQLYTHHIEPISAQLKQVIATSPKFFRHAPIVFDLSQLDERSDCDFTALSALLREHHFIPVGVRGGSASVHQKAQEMGLAVLPDNKANATLASRRPAQMPITLNGGTDTTASQKTKVINTPVRSGQQIYAEGGDLIITASVSNGAEIIADGHIHIYGTLRGRALAGAAGDKKAMIFCRYLQPEMVSIAGRYRLYDETNRVNQENAKVYLAEGRVCIDTV